MGTDKVSWPPNITAAYSSKPNNFSITCLTGVSFSPTGLSGCSFWGGVHLEKLVHKDSLPGVRSVIESMDIRGKVFNNNSEVANKPAQTRLAVKCTLRDIVTGNTGLKSAHTARNTAIQMKFFN